MSVSVVENRLQSLILNIGSLSLSANNESDPALQEIMEIISSQRFESELAVKVCEMLIQKSEDETVWKEMQAIMARFQESSSFRKLPMKQKMQFMMARKKMESSSHAAAVDPIATNGIADDHESASEDDEDCAVMKGGFEGFTPFQQNKHDKHAEEAALVRYNPVGNDDDIDCGLSSESSSQCVPDHHDACDEEKHSMASGPSGDARKIEVESAAYDCNMNAVAVAIADAAHLSESPSEDEQQQQQVREQHVAAYAHASAHAQTSVSIPSDKKACHQCTFHNALNAANCEICDAAFSDCEEDDDEEDDEEDEDEKKAEYAYGVVDMYSQSPNQKQKHSKPKSSPQWQKKLKKKHVKKANKKPAPQPKKTLMRKPPQPQPHALDEYGEFDAYHAPNDDYGAYGQPAEELHQEPQQQQRARKRKSKTWQCPQCSLANKRLANLCECGALKPLDPFEWECANCTVRNHVNHRRCQSCATTRVIADHQWQCPKCYAYSGQHDAHCHQCHQPKACNYANGTAAAISPNNKRRVKNQRQKLAQLQQQSESERHREQQEQREQQRVEQQQRQSYTQCHLDYDRMSSYNYMPKSYKDKKPKSRPKQQHQQQQRPRQPAWSQREPCRTYQPKAAAGNPAWSQHVARYQLPQQQQQQTHTNVQIPLQNQQQYKVAQNLQQQQPFQQNYQNNQNSYQNNQNNYQNNQNQNQNGHGNGYEVPPRHQAPQPPSSVHHDHMQQQQQSPAHSRDARPPASEVSHRSSDGHRQQVPPHIQQQQQQLQSSQAASEAFPPHIQQQQQKNQYAQSQQYQSPSMHDNGQPQQQQQQYSEPVHQVQNNNGEPAQNVVLAIAGNIKRAYLEHSYEDLEPDELKRKHPPKNKCGTPPPPMKDHMQAGISVSMSDLFSPRR